MPQIIILDGHTLSPGGRDPDWSGFEALGDVTYHDRTADEDVAQRIGNAQVAITNKAAITADVVDACPNLAYVGVTATGVNVVDIHACRARNITVTNVPAYAGDSVAQHVFALLLEVTNHVGRHHTAVRDGQWTDCPDFSFTLAPMWQLAGKTLGIVGVGAIGSRVARIAAGFGMDVIAARQRSQHDVNLPGVNIEWHALDNVFASADVLTLHCPLTDDTRHMVNERRIQLMKSAAVLINTGRGPLVDELALAAALHDGRIAAAGLDVLSEEPPPADNPLLAAPRCIITPHNAWAAVEARRTLMHIAVENLKHHLAGHPTHTVT